MQLQVTLTPAPTLTFQPHPEHDAQEFVSLTHLANRIDSHGYYGGVRLLMVSHSLLNCSSSSNRCWQLCAVLLNLRQTLCTPHNL